MLWFPLLEKKSIIKGLERKHKLFSLFKFASVPRYFSFFSVHSLFEKVPALCFAILVRLFFAVLSFPLVQDDLDLLFSSDLSISIGSHILLSFLSLWHFYCQELNFTARLPQPTDFGTKDYMRNKTHQE